MRAFRLLLAVAALSRPAFAADEVRVLVAPFQPTTPAAAGISSLLHSYLEDAIDRNAAFTVVPVERAPDVFDTSSEMYLDSCPPGQAVGCALIVGENAHVQLAITGTVERLDDGSRVQVSIVDIVHSRESLSITMDLAVGEDATFANAVQRLLAAVAEGVIGQEHDIRDEEEEVQTIDKDAVAAQLAALSDEIGDSSSLTVRRDIEIDRPRMTEEDIADKMDGEGVKPWEQVKMSPAEYLRYRNSGRSLPDWRARAAGRKQQIILAPTIGVLRGPVDSAYYGRYIRSESTLQVIETYAWQSVVNSVGLTGGGTVSYGLLPILEVGLTGGVVTGRYEADIAALTEGDVDRARDGQSYLNTSFYGGPRVLAAFFPASDFRPVVGGELLFWRAAAISKKVAFPEEVPTIDPASLVIVTGIVGGEVRLGPHLDLYLHVPLTAVVAGNTSEIVQEGNEYLENPSTPPAFGPIGAGLMAGFQVRLLGVRQDNGPKLDRDDPDL